MAEGKRPGGLTALAVLNFVFAGLGLIVVVGMFALLGAAEELGKHGEFHDAMEKTGNSAGVIYGLIFLMFIRVAIMLAAGVGYIQQKKFLGRTLGNTYAILALLDTVLGLALIKGSSFGIGGIIGLVYPVLTLILVNTTFKDDLVN
jgi:hypothetical protein